MGIPGLRSLLTFVVGFVFGAAARRTAVPPPRTAHSLPSSDIARAEQVFGYNILADAVRRSVDAVRFLDALFFALLAADVALLVVFQDTADARLPSIGAMFKVALVLDVIGFLPTLALRDVPDPKNFARIFVRTPELTRELGTTEFLDATAQNSVLRIVKTAVLLTALACTVAGTLALPGAWAVK